MMTTREPQHLSDAELMQLIDAEPDASVAAGTVGAHDAHETHADDCVACAARVQSLRDDAALVRQWFDVAAFELADAAGDAEHAGDPAHAYDAAHGARHVIPLPAGRVASPRNRARARVAVLPALPGRWLRAAAVLLLLAAPVAALPQLRQWLMHAVTGGATVDPTRIPMAAPSTQSASASFSFVPEGPTLAVALDELPAGGTLTLRRADGAEAELEIDAAEGVAGAAGPGPVLSGSGVRLRNDAASTATYAVSVPSTVTSVTVTAAGRTLGTFDRAAIAGIVVLQLGGRPAS